MWAVPPPKSPQTGAAPAHVGVRIWDSVHTFLIGPSVANVLYPRGLTESRGAPVFPPPASSGGRREAGLGAACTWARECRNTDR